MRAHGFNPLEKFINQFTFLAHLIFPPGYLIDILTALKGGYSRYRANRGGACQQAPMDL